MSDSKRTLLLADGVSLAWSQAQTWQCTEDSPPLPLNVTDATFSFGNVELAVFRAAMPTRCNTLQSQQTQATVAVATKACFESCAGRRYGAVFQLRAARDWRSRSIRRSWARSTSSWTP